MNSWKKKIVLLSLIEMKVSIANLKTLCLLEMKIELIILFISNKREDIFHIYL